MLNLLRMRAEDLYTQGLTLISEYSGTHPAFEPDAPLVLISANGSYYWNDLSSAGKALQVKLIPEINRFVALVSTLTQSLPPSSQRKLTHCLEVIHGAVEQDHSTWWESKEQAIEGFKNQFSELDMILGSYFGADTKEVLVIPDTNALLRNTYLEQWQFLDIKKFTFVLVPTILSELDSHKINHRNVDVRDKAQTLIRQLKEYCRRGSMHSGVTLVKDKISLRWIATEPDMEKTLGWFDHSNADDRFLATALEQIRCNLSATTFIVTDDINMMNKANYALIPCREVPHITKTDTIQSV